MTDGPTIAPIAAMIGDPARANMLTALIDGRALTVSELAAAGGVALSTASGHPHAMTRAYLALAARAGPKPVRTGPRDAELRSARVCYDHLAGARAVAMLAALVARGAITDGALPELTDAGRGWLAPRGIDLVALERSRRPACRCRTSARPAATAAPYPGPGLGEPRSRAGDPVQLARRRRLRRRVSGLNARSPGGPKTTGASARPPR